jgi:hypothetical protein
VLFAYYGLLREGHAGNSIGSAEILAWIDNRLPDEPAPSLSLVQKVLHEHGGAHRLPGRPRADTRAPIVAPPPLPRATEAPAFTGAQVASVLLPALIATPLRAIATGLAKQQRAPTRSRRYALHLGALAGRLLAPGGWSAAMPRASAEPWSTGRARPFDESTLRKSARAMSQAGALVLAEQALHKQVVLAVGAADVLAFTDMFDQVYWTKQSSWSGPIGSRGNRCLACTYFGMTFVRTDDGPLLALHVS